MSFICRIIRKTVAISRKVFYRSISDATVEGSPKCTAPLLAQGAGTVHFEKNVHVGLAYDTDFWTSHVFMNPRTKESRIEVGSDSWVGNHFVAISEGPGIFIGKNVLIGTRVEVYDSDFHTVMPNVRLTETPKRAAVKIADDVWIGNNVTILKGSEIGEHSVVAAGAVVSGKFPASVLIGGVPAKVIRKIDPLEILDEVAAHG
ncbi:MAG: acyltransferase [Fibrobacter sp.]|nr:acyltransferase [Fibrobacter sp.]